MAMTPKSLMLSLCLGLGTALVGPRIQAADESLTIEALMSAPFPYGLTAAPKGEKIAWIASSPAGPIGMEMATVRLDSGDIRSLGPGAGAVVLPVSDEVVFVRDFILHRSWQRVFEATHKFIDRHIGQHHGS